MIRGDRPVQEEEEIEITSGIIQAGALKLYDFLPDVQIGEDGEKLLVSEIYRAMHLQFQGEA